MNPLPPFDPWATLKMRRETGGAPNPANPPNPAPAGYALASNFATLRRLRWLSIG
jgi:hypothetical protein